MYLFLLETIRTYRTMLYSKWQKVFCSSPSGEGLCCYTFFLGLGFRIQGFTFAKQGLYCLSHNSNPCCCGYFGDGVLRTICPGLPQTSILWISASQTARIQVWATGARVTVDSWKVGSVYFPLHLFIKIY
jgi:hypothetical protein